MSQDIVERLKPLHTADEPIARAVISTDQAERLRTVEAYLIANNALKSEAASLITALTAERDALATEVTTLQQFVRDQLKYAGMDAKAAQALVQSMREALEPFAALAEKHHSGFPDDAYAMKMITVGDLRRALSALAQVKP